MMSVFPPRLGLPTMPSTLLRSLFAMIPPGPQVVAIPQEHTRYVKPIQQNPTAAVNNGLA
jgi:hypothetical protein